MLAFFQRFFINNPNGARVIEFLGHYMGTYFTEKIKVNNANGSPVKISVMIV
nr:hypothetical protein [Wolbachia endosymbiont of Wuchereria bancrofti]